MSETNDLHISIARRLMKHQKYTIDRKRKFGIRPSPWDYEKNRNNQRMLSCFLSKRAEEAVEEREQMEEHTTGEDNG